MEWLNFKDQLPEHGDKVLVLTKNNDILGAKVFLIRNEEKATGYYAICLCEAAVPIKQLTHWMPLPETPK